MSTTIHDESHLAIAEFLAAKLWEHTTWTKEKRAVFYVLRKYLIKVDANIVYKNSMNSLSTLGSSVYVSNLESWFPDDFVKSGTAEMRVLIGHRDKSGQNKGKEFAVLKLNSRSSEKHLDYFKRLHNHKDLIVHDLWFKQEFPEKIWETLKGQIQKNGPLEVSREDEGVGVSWYGIDTGNEDLDEKLLWKLEDSAIELQDLGGMYPCLEIEFFTEEIIAVRCGGIA